MPSQRIPSVPQVMSTDQVQIDSSPAVGPQIATWLRLEGLAVTLISGLLYARTGASWWLFAALWLAPDLAMLGYRAGPRIGASCYNTVHTYLLPIVLAAAGLLPHQNALLPYALIWCNHIGVDRLLGYGLKYPEGFGFTHLSRPGKPR